MSYCVTTDRIHDIARRLKRVVDCQAFESEQRMGRLLDYTPEGVRAILRILAVEQRRADRRRLFRRTVLCLAPALWIVLLPRISETALPALTTVVLFCPGLAFVARDRSERQIAAAESISRLQPEIAVPPLIELLPSRDIRTRRVAEASLIRLLPGLQRADILTGRHRRILHRELSWQRIRPHSDLMVAIIQALEACGDSRLKRTVRRLASHEFIIENGRRVQAAADSYLMTLSAPTLSPADCLLRPVESTEMNLLRPVGNIATDPNLLRPSAEPQNSEPVSR